MVILTFDIEEWALARAGGYGTAEKYAEYDSFLDKILSALEESGTKATFFCTGHMAEFFPQVVKRIQSLGHEIGCHSLQHTWMNKMSESEAREDTHRAVDLIEQCIGQKVLSYRAPAFSIDESNKWMFEILSENGITYDASIFPASRDFGGFPSFNANTPCIIEYNGIILKEFPISMARFIGKNVAYSGGGYFRFFPFGFVKRQIEKKDYSMCYFHINDLLPELSGIPTKEQYERYFKEPGTIWSRNLRYIKSNLGRSSAWKKLSALISGLSFANIILADAVIDWDLVNKVSLSMPATIEKMKNRSK